MANLKVILHCGAPKTGSTSFQHLLYAHRPALLKAGLYVPDVSRKRRQADDIRLVLAGLADSGRKPAPKALKRARELLRTIAAEHGCHTILVSHETILGKPIGEGGKSGRAAYPHATARIEAIRQALDGVDVEVRMVLRDYATFIPSWYVQQVRMGSTLTFEQFSRAPALNRFSWVGVVTQLRAAFGANRVRIYDHADLVKNPHALLSDAFPEIMAALGEAGRTLPRKNSSIGKGMVSVYRFWNRLAGRIPLSKARRNAIRQFGRRYVLLPFERFSRSEKIAFPADRASLFSERYRKHLARIAINRPGAA